ncbi:hypothetical protein MSAN_02025500 [Mycena sanguinolenta]|uniref:Uncharacterized protein n=1 Tax=Mycena sanguinolenta TaxID=230812 RepID=A0A8H6XKG5_9AGAR|nr:hypothetical protein MSAN_02025500 [Mycena sanguinolenta]
MNPCCRTGYTTLSVRNEGIDPMFLSRLSTLRSELDRRAANISPPLHPDSVLMRLRPTYTGLAAISALTGIHTLDEAVDAVTVVQRGLREREGWLRMVDVLLSSAELSVEELRGMDMPEADDAYMGLWVNGMGEREVLLYMRAGIPCFIAHEYLRGDITRDELRFDTLAYHDFVTFTDVEAAVVRSPYQEVADGDPSRRHRTFGEDVAADLPPTMGIQDRARSSSLYLEQLFPRFGPERDLHEEEPFSSADVLNERTPPMRDPPEVAVVQSRGDEGIPRASPLLPPAYLPREPPRAAANQYAAPAVETRSLDSARVPWVVPPPIQSKKKGKWSDWELEEFNGEPAWMHRGRNNRPHARNVRYDRQRVRRLYFGQVDLPEGVLYEERFGAPVPRFPFFMGGGAERSTAASFTLDRGRGESTQQEEENAKRKGKGRATTESADEDSDDGGMIVDESSISAPQSHVVVVRGADPQYSALMFRNLAADVFSRSSAPPESILNAQGMLWIRFPTTTEGVRAFGALPSLGEGVTAAFQSEEAFVEAARYTRDCWTLETTEETLPAYNENPVAAPVMEIPIVIQVLSPPAPPPHPPPTPPSAVPDPPVNPRPTSPAISSTSDADLALRDTIQRLPAPPTAPRSTPRGPRTERAPTLPFASNSDKKPRTSSTRSHRSLSQRLTTPSLPRPSLLERLSSPSTSAEAGPSFNRLGRRNSPNPPALLARLRDPESSTSLRDRLDEDWVEGMDNAKDYEEDPQDTVGRDESPRKKRRARGKRSGKMAREIELQKQFREQRREATRRHQEAEAALTRAEELAEVVMQGPVASGSTGIQPEREDVDMEDGEIAEFEGWTKEGDDDDMGPRGEE